MTPEELRAAWAQQAEAGQQGPTSLSQGQDLNWLEGMAGTALWSMGPGMIGVEPGGNLARWQAQNPVSSVGGQIGGMLVPYGAAFRASQTVAPWARLVGRAASPQALAARPFRAGAAREVARWAPFEAGLVAGGIVAGDTVADALGGSYRGAWENTKAGALNVALGGVVGGSLDKLGTMGRAAIQRRGVTPGADLGALPQVQIRQVEAALAGGKVAPEMVELARGGINRLRRTVINEDPAGGVFFRTGEEGVADQLNRLVRAGRDDRGWTSRKISSFQGEQAEPVLRGLAELGEGWEAFARYPRILHPRSAKSAKRTAQNQEEMEAALREALPGSTRGGTLRWRAMPDQGTFAVAKQLPEGRWVVFETDSPWRFLPDESRWADVIRRESLKRFEDIDPAVDFATVGSDILQYGRQVMRDMPIEDFRGLADPERGVAAGLRAGFQRLGLESRAQNTTEGLRRLGVFSRAYLAPADLQFTQNPIAHRIRRVAKEMVERAEKMTQDAILGVPTNTGRNLLRETALGPAFDNPGSIAATVKALAKREEDWTAVLRTIHSGEGIDYGVRNLGLSDEGAALLRRIEDIDKGLSRSIIEAQRASGIPENEIFRPREGHFMLSRTWKGNWRTPVYNERGQLVYVAGGENRRESLEMARRIAEERGFRVPHDRDALTTDLWGDLDMMRKVAINSQDYRTAMQQAARMVSGRQPGTFQQRSGVEGFVMDYTPEQFLRSLVQHSRRYRNYEAEISTQALFKRDMERLALDDREVAEQLKKRLDMMFGKEGELSKAINKASDTILAPMIGNQSASRILGALNSGMYRYSLGFINIGYGIATLLTFAQTAFPMMSMINTLATKAPQRLGKYTSYKPIMSESGADVMGLLDPMKIAGQAFKELGDADQLLAQNLRRAAAEGTTDPRFLDEFVGQHSLNKQRFKEILRSDEPVVGFLRTIADAVPASTERFSRGHSFTMGHIFYRDVMGVRDPEHLYRLAKEFTDKTQYLYGTGDRAQIITGPIGSSFGLFKNWVMNYIGWMAAYAGEGFTRNNWKPLLYMLGGTGAIGGVGALPMIGTYNAVSKMMGGDSAMYQIYEGFNGTGREGGPGIADMIYYGLPMALGISVQNTVQAPFHDPTEDAARFFQIATWDQGKKVGRAIGSTWDSLMRRGQNPILDPMVQQHLAQAFAPKSVYRAVSMSLGDQVVSQNNNNPLVVDMSPSERLLHGLSLNPRWVSTRFAFAREMWKDEAAYRKRMQGLGRDMADAMEAGDRVQMERIIYAAIADNISVDSIMRSAQTRRSRREEDIITSQFDEESMQRLRRLGLL